MVIKNVLLVDDDPNIRLVTQIALEDVGGLTVIAVDSGQEALNTLSEVTPDVILLDMMMPGMDGKTTLGKIKSSGFEHIPVIFMTAKVQSDELQQYESLGIAGVISKPFDPMTLADEIKRIVSNSK